MSKNNAQQSLRNRQLGQIHIAKKDLGLTDDDYEAVLWTVCRVRSSAELDLAGRAKLIEHFKSKGWKPKRGKKSSNGKAAKIRALWISMADVGIVRDRTEKALGNYCLRVGQKQSPDWLTDAGANKVIESLKSWQKRESVKGEGEE